MKLKCCFTSTETGVGSSAQDGHLDVHTAQSSVSGNGETEWVTQPLKFSVKRTGSHHGEGEDTEREREGERDRQRHTQRNRDRQTQRETETERQKERQTDRDTQRGGLDGEVGRVRNYLNSN